MARTVAEATIAFKGSDTVVPVLPEEIPFFIAGEIPPRIADRYVASGMPRRGLVTFKLVIHEAGEVRIVGPSLCRRAGTASSAREK